MKNINCKNVLLMFTLLPFIILAQQVTSIKNAADLQKFETPSINSRWIDDQADISKSFVNQPPLIPHSIERYKINMSENRCLSCHSKENAKNEDAKEISATHYKDRDGVKHETMSASRYFCTQCHVPQKDTDLLYKNSFKP